MTVSNGSLIRHVGLLPSMLVSDGSPIRYVGLRWAMLVSEGSPMNHFQVSDQVCRSLIGFQSGMSVSNQVCLSPMDLRQVSDNNNIYVNSIQSNLSPTILNLEQPFFTYVMFRSSQKYSYYRRPVGNLSETYQRQACLNGYPSQTDMPARRPQHDSRETDIPEQGPYIIPIYIIQQKVNKNKKSLCV